MRDTFAEPVGESVRLVTDLVAGQRLARDRLEVETLDRQAHRFREPRGVPQDAP